MRDDQRQRVLVRGADVDEVNAEPVDLGREVRQVVQSGFALVPVVAVRPVGREVLHERQPHALRVVGDRLAVGPPGRADAPPQVGELCFRETDTEGPEFIVAGHKTCSFSRTSWYSHHRRTSVRIAPVTSLALPAKDLIRNMIQGGAGVHGQ